MDHMRIVRRAFQITRDYRVLWLFGILLALTTASPGGNPGGGGGGNRGGMGPFDPPGMPQIPEPVISTIITVGILVACVVLLLIVASSIIRYLSETALIRMADRYEATGEKVTWREGFRLGWSRAAFRVFLIDLVIGLAMLVVALLLFAVAALPLLVWLTQSEGARIIGSVTAAGLGVIVLLFLIAASIVISLVVQFMRRAAVLENLGVMESIRRGFNLVRQRVGDAVLMGLIVFALGLGWTILMIPVVIVLFMAGAIVGGLPGLLVGWLATLATQSDTAWIAGMLVGLPIFLAVVVIPALFLNGLFETFKANTWTLTYREFLALGAGTTPAAVGVYPIEEGPIDESLTDEGLSNEGLEDEGPELAE